MTTNIRRIPKTFIDQQRRYADTEKDATLFPLKLFPYDGFDKENNTGFSSKEDFVSTVLDAGSTPVFEIVLNPSIVVGTKDFSVGARWIKNIINFSQREDDITSLIYSQERPVYQVDTQLDLRDRLVWWTQETIFGDDVTDVRIEKDTPVFIIDSYDEQYSETGVFQYATLVLKRVVSYKASNRDTTGSGVTSYIKFDWFRFNIQPTNARRLRRTWKSRPIRWFKDIRDGNNDILDWTYTPRTTGDDTHRKEYTPFITPFLPRKIGGTQINFVPTYVNEYGYWNANHEKRNLTTKNLISFDGITTASSDGVVQISGLDQTPIRGAIPLKRYAYSFFETSIISGAQRPELYRILSQTLDFSSPLNFMGFIRNSDINTTTDRSLPRKENDTSAVWKTFESQAFYYGDMASNSVSLALVYYNEVITGDLEWILTSNIIAYELLAKEIVKGAAVMFGETINLRPPNSYDFDFDFSPNPVDWDLENLKKYTGVFFIGVDEQLQNGNSTSFELEDIGANDLPNATSETIGVGFGSFHFQYGTSTNIKARLSGRSWYKNYNENWVEEIEWPSNVPVITVMDDKYFGGYEYTDEWFSNSYEESLTQGDIYCKFEFDGVEYNLPPLTSRASNKRGNPTSYGEKKIWGSGGTYQEKQTIGKFNQKQINNNKKKLISVQTGKTIKNKHYKKENT